MDGMRSRPTATAWPLWRTELGQLDDVVAFYRDRLLDGRDAIPSYGHRVAALAHRAGAAG